MMTSSKTISWRVVLPWIFIWKTPKKHQECWLRGIPPWCNRKIWYCTNLLTVHKIWFCKSWILHQALLNFPNAPPFPFSQAPIVVVFKINYFSRKPHFCWTRNLKLTIFQGLKHYHKQRYYPPEATRRSCKKSLMITMLWRLQAAKWLWMGSCSPGSKLDLHPPTQDASHQQDSYMFSKES